MYLPNDGDVEVRVEENGVIQSNYCYWIGLDLYTRIEVDP